ncbi:MAG: helix-turn-helix transcriptional regulator [Solirubrobacteraceae bacterium]|jgi:transcriptional regulator with XRE-family HTH domain
MSTPPESEPAAGADQDATLVAGIGAALREARERRGLSRAEVETRLKIRDRYLQAIEDESWDRLPGYAFARGFLRSYAQLLGLDGDALVAEFKRVAQDQSEPELSVLVQPQPEPRPLSALEPAPRRALRGPPAALAGLLAVLAIAAGVAYATGVLGAGQAAPSPARRSPPHTIAPRRPVRSHDHRRTSSKDSHRGALSAGRVSLRLVPTGRVWVCLVAYPTAAATGGLVDVNGILAPASPQPLFTAGNHFLVTFGNDLVRMSINGRESTAASSPGNVVSYAIERDGSYRVIPRSAAPTCS